MHPQLSLSRLILASQQMAKQATEEEQKEEESTNCDSLSDNTDGEPIIPEL